MENDNRLGISLLKRALIFTFAPLAFCGAAYAACLAVFGDGDRLGASLVAVMVQVVPMFVLVLVAFVRLGLVHSSRVNALMAAFIASAYCGLLALVVGLGWALAGVLGAHHGAVALGGALASAFAVGVLVALIVISKQVCGLRAAHTAVLAPLPTSVLAAVAYAGSGRIALALAIPSALVLAIILIMVPRYAPPACKPLFGSSKPS